MSDYINELKSALSELGKVFGPDDSWRREDILQFAIENYPVGTKIFDPHNNTEHLVTLTPYFYCDREDHNGLAGAPIECVIYYGGQWSEIIN